MHSQFITELKKYFKILRISLLVLFMIHATSCTSSKALILNQPLLTSYYMENKIERLQKSASDDLESKREIAISKIEYSGGILMEEADRLIDLDYSLGLEKYKKSNALFLEARDDFLNIL